MADSRTAVIEQRAADRGPDTAEPSGAPTTARRADTPRQSATPPRADASPPGEIVVASEVLVEEISIDGMCGVY